MMVTKHFIAYMVWLDDQNSIYFLGEVSPKRNCSVSFTSRIGKKKCGVWLSCVFEMNWQMIMLGVEKYDFRNRNLQNRSTSTCGIAQICPSTSINFQPQNNGANIKHILKILLFWKFGCFFFLCLIFEASLCSRCWAPKMIFMVFTRFLE